VADDNTVPEPGPKNADVLTEKELDGITGGTFPDVCKTPTAGGPVPIPYPNVAAIHRR